MKRTRFSEEQIIGRVLKMALKLLMATTKLRSTSRRLLLKIDKRPV